MSDDLTPLQLIVQGVHDGSITDKTRINTVEGPTPGGSNDTLNWVGVSDPALRQRLNELEMIEVQDLVIGGYLVDLPDGFKVDIGVVGNILV